MELKEVQISEIKNLKLIYVFTTDSIFKNESNKYVGAKVVFDKNKTFSLDYKDKHFSMFIKRILERYHKEKDKRKIILLGDLTKKLVSDSSFAVLDKTEIKGTQEVGLPSYNTSDNEIKKYDSFLKEVIGIILTIYKNYEVLNISSIKGFNNKYMVTYHIGPVEKQIPIIISKVDNDTIEFRLSRVDGSKVPVSGTIKSDGGLVNITWQSNDEKVKASITYDALENIVERKVTSDDETIIYDESKDTILEEDISLINFYFSLCCIPVPSHILKTSDNSFLLADEITLSEDDKELLYANTGAVINVLDDEVNLKYRVKNCFSKYNNQINAVLDEETEEVTFRKIKVDDKHGILIEHKSSSASSKDTYTYEVLELSEEVDMRNIFNVERRYAVDKELRTLETAKQYIRQYEGGKK